MTGPPGNMTGTPYPGRKARMDALSDVTSSSLARPEPSTGAIRSSALLCNV